MNCPACGNETAPLAHAIIAPFILALANQDSSVMTPTTLRNCATCTLAFFSHRFTSEELAAIYGRYRSSLYLSTRQKWEPWYRRAVNDAFSEETSDLNQRVKFMEEIIDGAVRTEFQLTVDLGGDGGQFFTHHSSGRKIVIDVSDKPLAPGIERAASLDLIDGEPDLVLICHVLEHVNEPNVLLRDVKQHLAPEGWLYIEVPLDRPRVRQWHLNSNYKRYITLVSTQRWALISSDFYSGVARQFGLRVPRIGLVKQSEHINYFNEKSLHMILTQNGFEIIDTKVDSRASVGGLRLGKLGVLARPTAERRPTTQDYDNYD